jgi:hypothetical protein
MKLTRRQLIENALHNIKSFQLEYREATETEIFTKESYKKMFSQMLINTLGEENDYVVHGLLDDLGIPETDRRFAAQWW